MVASIDPVNIDEVDADKYELEFVRCEVESLEDTEAYLSGNPFDNPIPLTVVAEFRITNLDDIRRRFHVRATRIDPEGSEASFIPRDTSRLDPGESSVEQMRLRLADGVAPPFTCRAEVWDSTLDIAFPND